MSLHALADHLWQSTLFAGVAGLLTLVFRRNRAAVRHALWLAASVKFLVPFSVLIGMGSLIEWRKAPAAVQPQVTFVMEEISQPFALRGPAPVVASVPRTPSRVPEVLLGVWMCGFAANGWAWWRRWRRVRAALRAASPLSLNLPIPAMSSPARLEPGVFGIRKPVLLLPEGILDRLTPAQFQAIIAHELCHVQRRDNLAAAIHMVVEALYWFHPLVWWIQARLVEERERACDEEVLRMTGDPLDYAEGILNVCKLYLESPLVCVSGVTGSNLKRRVEAIMMNCGALKMNFGRKVLLAFVGMLAVAGPVIVGVLNAPAVRGQSPVSADRAVPPVVAQATARPQSTAAAAPEFEVAVIRQNKSDNQAPVQKPGDGQGSVLPGGQFTMRNAALKTLLGFAFNPLNQKFRDNFILGAPAWVDSDRFDILGKGPPDMPPRECFFSNFCLPDKPLALMLQRLLEKEFKIVQHQEQKPMDVYALVAGKGGPKLQKAAGSGERVCRRIVGGSDDPDAKDLSAIQAGFVCANITMADFAALLPEMAGAYIDRVVVDLTGLKGTYDFKLVWVGKALIDEGGLTVFDAVDKQLGLKLESRKVPMPVTVIDHIEKLADDN